MPRAGTQCDVSVVATLSGNPNQIFRNPVFRHRWWVVMVKRPEGAARSHIRIFHRVNNATTNETRPRDHHRKTSPNKNNELPLALRVSFKVSKMFIPTFDASALAVDVLDNVCFYRDEMLHQVYSQKRETVLQMMTIEQVYLQFTKEYPHDPERGLWDLCLEIGTLMEPLLKYFQGITIRVEDILHTTNKELPSQVPRM